MRHSAFKLFIERFCDVLTKASTKKLKHTTFMIRSHIQTTFHKGFPAMPIDQFFNNIHCLWVTKDLNLTLTGVLGSHGENIIPQEVLVGSHPLDSGILQLGLVNENSSLWTFFWKACSTSIRASQEWIGNVQNNFALAMNLGMPKPRLNSTG